MMSDERISLQIIDQFKIKEQNNRKNQTKQVKYHDTFNALKKNSTNLFNQRVFTDDQFKLQQIKLANKTNRKIVVSRLKDFIPPGTPLFGQQIKNNFNSVTKQLPHYPRFICQMHTLPFWHYENLIQPKYVNEQGFYHVVIWRQGKLVKQTIDDTFYYDQIFKTIYTQCPFFQNYIWMHILLKVWAKQKGGFSQIFNANPFDFIKTFSYPDWKIINPSVQDVQKLISYISPIQKKQIFSICQTKNDPNVGLFGLIPNSASYILIGHQMQFQAIFIKIKSLNGTKWNKLKSSQQSCEPQDEIKLKQNEFIMPLKQFINVFHLIYITSNKFQHEQDIFYNIYSLNLDARQSKAKIVSFEVSMPNQSQYNNQKQAKQSNYMTNITIYFPSIRAYDLTKQRNQRQSQQFVIPYCKIMIGMQSQTTNLQASFVQSMKQKMLQNQDADFLYGKSSIQYDWIEGTYFKGFDNCCTFLMKIKPGRYYLRFKIQTLKVEYRANINIISSTQIKVTDPKMDKLQQHQFLKQILSNKARLQKRNLGYLNPIKKGSWYICNDDFNSIGYGYLVIQTRKASDYRIQLKIDPKMLKQIGYRLKQKKDQSKYNIFLQQGEGFTLIFKLQDQFLKLKQRVWPPQGIQIIRHWKKQ